MSDENRVCPTCQQRFKRLVTHICHGIRSGVCENCQKTLKRLDLHVCRWEGMPLAEIHEKYPSTAWGQEEWFQAFKQDNGLFNAILSGIAGTNLNRLRGNGEI